MSSDPDIYRVLKRQHGRVVAVLTAQRVVIDDGNPNEHFTVKYIAFYQANGNPAELGKLVWENNEPKYFSRYYEAIDAAWEKAQLDNPLELGGIIG